MFVDLELDFWTIFFEAEGITVRGSLLWSEGTKTGGLVCLKSVEGQEEEFLGPRFRLVYM